MRAGILLGDIQYKDQLNPAKGSDFLKLPSVVLCGELRDLAVLAASWVSVAQLARAAEVDTLQLQHHSVVPLVTWANATAWMVLALPHMVRRKQDHATGCQLLETTAFQAWHPPRFLFIALTTNFSYIGALHYLPASLNTAIFSSNPARRRRSDFRRRFGHPCGLARRGNGGGRSQASSIENELEH
eukprot:g19380.t1